MHSEIPACYNASMSENVLLLNANYEPINVCGMQKAIGLMVTDKASLILNGRGIIKTASSAYPKPSILRLNYMIHRPRPRLKLTRTEIFRRDDYTCQYCGKSSTNLTIDHVIPRHLGGVKKWTNLVTACPVCNHRKGGKSLQEANMTLIHLPQEPPANILYMHQHHLREHMEWEPYLTGW